MWKKLEANLQVQHSEEIKLTFGVILTVLFLLGVTIQPLSVVTYGDGIN